MSLNTSVTIRPLVESDLVTADRIMNLAFGTYLRAPEPEKLFGDKSYVRTRWRADPSAAFAAELDGEVVGSNFAGSWGSVGFFGPLTLRPDHWDKGIGKLLVRAVMDLFAMRGMKHLGLYTFADSPRHIGLYQSFGFHPRFLTMLLAMPVIPRERTSGWIRFSESSGNEQQELLKSSFTCTASIYPGLDLRGEIAAVADQGLGDTILLRDEQGVSGIAVCHFGAGPEAGSGILYVKFGAVKSGSDSPQNFHKLIGACEQLANVLGATSLSAGVNSARAGAYHQMLEYGFRIDRQGIAMHQPNEPGYSHPDAYVIDDWR